MKSGKASMAQDINAISRLPVETRPLPPTPRQRNWCRPAARRGNPPESCAFRYRETTDFDCPSGGANQLPGRELHPPMSSAFLGALFRQLFPHHFFPPMRGACKEHELAGEGLRSRFSAFVGSHCAVSQHVRESVYLLLIAIGVVHRGFAVSHTHSAIHKRLARNHKKGLLSRDWNKRDSFIVSPHGLGGHTEGLLGKPN